MDNECAKETEKLITKNNATIQFVEPDQHRVNAAERAIQLFKNHFIAGLCTVHKSFPPAVVVRPPPTSRYHHQFDVIITD